MSSKSFVMWSGSVTQLPLPIYSLNCLWWWRQCFLFVGVWVLMMTTIRSLLLTTSCSCVEKKKRTRRDLALVLVGWLFIHEFGCFIVCLEHALTSGSHSYILCDNPLFQAHVDLLEKTQCALQRTRKMIHDAVGCFWTTRLKSTLPFAVSKIPGPPLHVQCIRKRH